MQEPCILPNPKDPTRLVMFYSGVPEKEQHRCYVGKAWALRSDPFTWHQDAANPVFGPGKDGWDSGSMRLDAVLYIPEEDAYYMYYSATHAITQDRIGLAVCPAGADGYSDIREANIRRVGTGPVLAPEEGRPFEESMVSQAAVLREWDAGARRWNWFMYYSYRGANGILPGIRLATSSDGKEWKRRFNGKDPRRMGHVFDSTPNAFYEWHQVFKLGATYVLSMEVGPERGKQWRTVVAVSHRPDEGWVQLDLDTVLQSQWEGLYSDGKIFHVATPAFHRIDGRWYLYAQACPLPPDGNYISGLWDIWCIACDREIPTLPDHARLFIPGRRPPRS